MADANSEQPRSSKMRLTRSAWVFAVIAIVGTCGSCASSGEQPENYVQITDLEDVAEARVTRHSGPVNQQVDLSGLDINKGCASAGFWDSIETLRVELLAAGCARLDGPAISEDEEATEGLARRNEVGIWSPNWRDRLNRDVQGAKVWFTDNQQLIISLAGLPFIWWLAQWLWQLKYRRRARVVFVGMPAAGKSELMTAWLEGTAHNLGASPTTRVKVSKNTPSIPMGRFVVKSVLVDTAGSNPAQIRSQLIQSGMFAKRVVVLVMSPTPRDSLEEFPNGPDEVEGLVDMSYVREQSGYGYLVRALVGDFEARPHAIICFVSKFDLFSDARPYDKNGESVRSALDAIFFDHQKSIEKTCKGSKCRTTWIYGSSKLGWEVERLRNEIVKAVTGEGYVDEA
ncbi:MAG: GTPase domain-containing protein [Microthrixaceae bacterium]